MANWKEFIVKTIKLADEMERVNEDMEKLDGRTIDIDKRLVRVETLLENSK